MPFNEFKEKISLKFLENIGIDISDIQCQQFFDFMNLLIEKNKVINLTTIVEPDEIIVRHFLDSCMMIKFFKENDLDGKRIVDVGTGAGFPGLPLAIMLQKTNFVLTDTLGKRIKFLQEVLDCIGTNNVQLIKARAEDFAHEKGYREQFDYIVSRGVARFSVLSEYSLPLLAVGGKMLAYKMNDCDEELKEGAKAISVLGGMFHVKHPYDIVDREPERCIVEIDKVKTAPSKYPRKAGTPSKEPL